MVLFRSLKMDLEVGGIRRTRRFKEAMSLIYIIVD